MSNDKCNNLNLKRFINRKYLFMFRYTFLIICGLLLVNINLFSQTWENIGAGVLDFLRKNPSTNKNMSPGGEIAVEIISDLLKTESQRKHELKYASSSANQITVNTNQGERMQFVKNEAGKVFVLFNGIVYPISDELINTSITKTDNNENDINYLPDY